MSAFFSGAVSRNAGKAWTVYVDVGYAFANKQYLGFSSSGRADTSERRA